MLVAQCDIIWVKEGMGQEYYCDDINWLRRVLDTSTEGHVRDGLQCTGDMSWRANTVMDLSVPFRHLEHQAA